MKKDIVNQKRLSEELGIDFNEAVELFSEETLNSMKMENVIGGSSIDSNVDCGLKDCFSGNFLGCGCGNNGC